MTTATKTKLTLAAALLALGLAGCTTANSSLAAIEPAAFVAAPADPAAADLALADDPNLQAADEPAVDMASAGDVQMAGDDSAPKESFFARLIPGRQFTSAFSGGSRERNCLMRAMYFESNRSSTAGELAVGTVVMNRLASGQHGRSVCAVVGERGQFAPGVMSRRLQGDTRDLEALAGAILRGKRHPGVRQAMHFHQQGLHFPYSNMHYVLNAGGNSFYEKRSRRRR